MSHNVIKGRNEDGRGYYPRLGSYPAPPFGFFLPPSVVLIRKHGQVPIIRDNSLEDTYAQFTKNKEYRNRNSTIVVVH